MMTMTMRMMLTMSMPVALMNMPFHAQPRTELRQSSPAVRRDGGPVAGTPAYIPECAAAAEGFSFEGIWEPGS